MTDINIGAFTNAFANCSNLRLILFPAVKQITQNSILETQNSILSMVESINKKLNDDKIEEKAYLSDKLIKIILNWIFWVAFVGTIAFAGMGVLKILDKADNISTIVKSVK